MIKKIFFAISLAIICVLVSCGAYKRNTTETNLQQKVVESQRQQNDVVIEEILETTLDYYGADSTSVFKPTKAQPKQWSKTTKKTTKTVDKGTLDKNIKTDIDLDKKAAIKENPWQPPWYLSGLIVIGLLVAWKIFKTNFKIVKR